MAKKQREGGTGEPCEAWAAMAQAAGDYCEWIELLPLLERSERQSAEVCAAHLPRMKEARRHMLALLGAGAALEIVEPPERQAPSRDVDHEAYLEIGKRAAVLPIGYYRTVMYGEDLVGDLDAMIGDVSDDLADTWRDLKEGLLSWHAGEHAEAAWKWRFSFQFHWGSHGVDGLRQIQGWISENDDGS